MAYYGWGDFPRYVSVAERRSNGARHAAALKKKGRVLDAGGHEGARPGARHDVLGPRVVRQPGRVCLAAEPPRARPQLSAGRNGHRSADSARHRDRARERVRPLRDRRADHANARAALEDGGEGLRRQDRLRGRAPRGALRRERDGPRLPPGHRAVPGPRGDHLRVQLPGRRPRRMALQARRRHALRSRRAPRRGPGAPVPAAPRRPRRPHRPRHRRPDAATGPIEAQRPPRDRLRPAVRGVRHRARGPPLPRTRRPARKPKSR